MYNILIKGENNKSFYTYKTKVYTKEEVKEEITKNKGIYYIEIIKEI